METVTINQSFKEVTESLLASKNEVIFIKDNNNIGEITHNTPYKVINLYQKIFSHVVVKEYTLIGKRAYIAI